MSIFSFISLPPPFSSGSFVASPMAFELMSVFRYVDTVDKIRAVVVTGKGKAFCAGADLTPQGIKLLPRFACIPACTRNEGHWHYARSCSITSHRNFCCMLHHRLCT